MELPLLQVRDLTTKFKINQEILTIVDRISFNLYKGKTLALVGESGCGKSMTALSLMGMVPSPPALSPTGSVLYNNKNLLTLTEKEMRKIRGSNIAMIFQDPMSSLNPVYTVGDQLAEVAEVHLNLSRDEALQSAEEALKSVGISNASQRLFSYPHQLSGGIKQRVMIAMALMCEPDILIADEPTTALDVTIQAQVLELFKDLQQKRGLSILLITHDMGVVAEVADEVMVMYTAQGVEKGRVKDVFTSPSHPYTLGLFQSIPSIDQPKGTLKPIRGQVPSLNQLPTGCRFHPRCPFLMEKCRHEQVKDFTIDVQQTHTTKCLLHDKSEESLLKLPALKLEG